MQFIADTATAFSGNPQRVTIFGESAGSGSVSDHLVAHRSWGLFQVSPSVLVLGANEESR
jgi:para-nitrobenzyl esterase